MKVLHVIPYFTPMRGGDVNVCYNLCKRLARLGYDITIITTDLEFDEEYAQTLEEWVRVIPFHCIANVKLFLVSPAIRKWVRNNIKSFDIVHLHDFRSYQNNIVCSYATKYGIPYVLQPHGSTPRVVGNKSLKWLYDVVFGYRILRNVSHVIAVSKEEADYDIRMGVDETKIRLIYNGMNLPSSKILPIQGTFRMKYGIQGKMILYLGRIHKWKGIDFAMRAFSKLCHEIDEATFVIAGPDDGYRTKLEKLIKEENIIDRVKFVGALSEDEKPYAYVDADLFIHTVTYMSGVGLAPLEAISYGTPVIVTEECGEIIREADCGYFVRYGDVVSLASIMRSILENKDEAMRMVEKGKQYIEENLLWDIVVRKVEDVYKNSLHHL